MRHRAARATRGGAHGRQGRDAGSRSWTAGGAAAVLIAAALVAPRSGRAADWDDSGSFTSPVSITSYDPIVGDYNGDGLEDVISPANPSGMLPGTSDGNGWGAGQLSPTSAWPGWCGSWKYEVATVGCSGDINGDGYSDALLFWGAGLANCGSSYFYPWLYMGHEDFDFSVEAPRTFDHGIVQECSTPRCYMFDADSDGDVDVLVLCSRAAGSEQGDPRQDNKLWVNDGQGFFTDEAAAAGLQLSSSHENPAQGHAVGDFDNDGDMDIAFIWAASAPIYLNDGSGVFTARATPSDDWETEMGVGPQSPLTSSEAGNLHVVDIDGDGDDDILVVRMKTAGDRVYLNNGDGTLTSGTSTHITYTTRPSTSSGNFESHVVDFDEDGEIDLVASTPGGTYSYSGLPSGGTLLTDNRPIPEATTQTKLVWKDMDADGDVDACDMSAGTIHTNPTVESSVVSILLAMPVRVGVRAEVLLASGGGVLQAAKMHSTNGRAHVWRNEWRFGGLADGTAYEVRVVDDLSDAVVETHDVTAATGRTRAGFLGAPCAADADCAGVLECNDDACTLPRGAASCSDSLLNQDESDVDCGGAACGGCDLGGACGVDGDCASGVCHDGGCATGVASLAQVLDAHSAVDTVFGYDIDVDGTLMAVSRPLPEPGKVIVYELGASGEWEELDEIVGLTNKKFGHEVKVKNGQVFVSVIAHERYTGATYVYEDDGDGTFTKVQTITHTGGGEYDGPALLAVNADASRFVVGNGFKDQSFGQSIAYLWDGSAYSSETKIVDTSCCSLTDLAVDPPKEAERVGKINLKNLRGALAYSAAYFAGHVVVAAPTHIYYPRGDANQADMYRSRGMAFVFDEDFTTQTDAIDPAEYAADDVPPLFGWCMAASDDTGLLFIGGSSEGPYSGIAGGQMLDASPVTGRIFVFSDAEQDGVVEFVTVLRPPRGRTDLRWPTDIDVAPGGILAVGASWASMEAEGNPNAGSLTQFRKGKVFIFERGATDADWVEVASVTAPTSGDPDATAVFGMRVRLMGGEDLGVDGVRAPAHLIVGNAYRLSTTHGPSQSYSRAPAVLVYSLANVAFDGAWSCHASCAPMQCTGTGADECVACAAGYSPEATGCEPATSVAFAPHGNAGSCAHGLVPALHVDVTPGLAGRAVDLVLELDGAHDSPLPLAVALAASGAAGEFDVALAKTVDAGTYDFVLRAFEQGRGAASRAEVAMRTVVTCAGADGGVGTRNTATLSLDLKGFAAADFTGGGGIATNQNALDLADSVARGLGVEADDVDVVAAEDNSNSDGAVVSVAVGVLDSEMAADRTGSITLDTSSAAATHPGLAFAHAARVASRLLGVCCTAHVGPRCAADGDCPSELPACDADGVCVEA